MKGLSVEPGERTACVMSTWPARRDVEIIRRADRAPAPRRSRRRPTTMATDMSGPSALARSRRAFRARFCRAASMVSRCTLRVRRCRERLRRRHAARASASACAPSATGSCLARAISSSRHQCPSPAMRSSTRSRAALRGVRRSGRGGALPAIAAAPPAAPPRRASAAAAPCRNRRARRRGCLRDCRHRARGQIERRGSRPC